MFLVPFINVLRVSVQQMHENLKLSIETIAPSEDTTHDPWFTRLVLSLHEKEVNCLEIIEDLNCS